MSPVTRIMSICTAFGAVVVGGLAFVIASNLFWGGLIAGAMTGAALGVVFVFLSEQEKN